MSLGTALEQWGEVERGEKALRRATELAPSYAYPRWYLGNLLLRSGRYNQAFAELRRAADADPELRSQLLNLAWATTIRTWTHLSKRRQLRECSSRLASYLV